MNFRWVIIAVGLWSGCSGVETPMEEERTPDLDDAAKEANVVWRVVPSAIRYDDASKMVFVEAGIDAELNGANPREKEAYVGVTLAAQDGEEYDLAIQTIFPAQLDQKLMFSAEVEKPIVDVLIGLWDHKVEPCDSERPGCKTYGFLLDGSLASWPPNLYTDYKRQRIVPNEVTVQWAGTVDATTKASFDTFLKDQLAVFGSTAKPGAASAYNKDGVAAVYYRVDKDEVLAGQLAAQLNGSQSTWTFIPKQSVYLGSNFVVYVPDSVQGDKEGI